MSLAEAGAEVVLFEALTYPGGCASTFTRRGLRFEAGATLSSGLGEQQLFGRWIRRHELPVEVDWIDPVVEVRAPGFALQVSRDRAAFVDALCALPGAPVGALQAFFEEQRQLADVLWELFDDPELLPPVTLSSLAAHLWRSPRYAPLLPWVARPLAAGLRARGLEGWAPLRTCLGGLCQITVQCPPEEAEAPFALAAMDYYWRGTGHIRGGIGRLAEALAGAVGRLGGQVRFAQRVRSLRREGAVWRVEARDGAVEAPVVVSNLLPGDTASLLDPSTMSSARAALERRHAPVADGWGAVMLYGVAPEAALPPAAHHYDLTVDPDLPLTDGNHVFVSLAAPDDARGTPPGGRAYTASTHVSLRDLRDGDPGAIVAAIQARMRGTIRDLAPELGPPILEMTASPRTFARFTRRRDGAVGGVPRRAGWANYAHLWPESPAPGLWLAGDTVFPGQSTFAAALGGTRVARAIRG